MKKLLLASNGQFLISKGYGVLGLSKDKMNIGWITTASKGARDASYLERHRAEMTAQGYMFEEIDIEAISDHDLYKKLEKKNIIHVEGGNTFYLLKAVKEKGFDAIVSQLISKNVIYVGTSAGAYIACPTIDMATWGTDQKDRYGVTDLTALNLVPFLIKAHYIDQLQELLKEIMRHCKYPVRLLRDGQGILIEDSTYTFVGEGKEAIL